MLVKNRRTSVSGLDMGDHVPNFIHTQRSTWATDLNIIETLYGRRWVLHLVVFDGDGVAGGHCVEVGGDSNDGVLDRLGE